jgi:two-component sensor histidine kinase
MPEPAQALAMVFHELVTNAVKYGALSTMRGRLVVRWQVAGEIGSAHLNLVWQEADGPTVTPPKRTGFGTRLINNVVHHELGRPGRAEPAADGSVLRDRRAAGARRGKQGLGRRFPR